MVKHTQTIPRQKPTNCLSVFDHFVGLALKELKYSTLFKKLLPRRLLLHNFQSDFTSQPGLQ